MGEIEIMFKCDESITSYTRPIFKIICCCILIVLLINRWDFNNSYINVFLTVVGFVVMILAILRIYLSFAEMLLLHERRTEAKIGINKAMKYSEEYTVENIISILGKNDIVDILILVKNQIIKLESSSENFPESSEFINKKYSIDEHFVELEEIKEKLTAFTVNDKICVISIDGLPPSKTKQ